MSDSIGVRQPDQQPADEAVARFTPGPWTWAEFGGHLMLVTVHDGSKVVLGTHGTEIVTRDERGVLVPLTADHPIAQAMRALPDAEAIERCLKFVAFTEHGEAAILSFYGPNFGGALVNASRALRMTHITVQVGDATAECPIVPGRDGWELDSPETETRLGGEWVNPDHVKVLDHDTWRTLTELLIGAAEDCDQRPEQPFGSDHVRDAAE